MNKMLAAVFNDEKSAYEGLDALRKLHRQGDISLYSATVISKTHENGYDTKNVTDDGATGTAVGLVTGTLIGMLAGPVGVIAGASIGSLSGLLVDVNRSGVDLEFVSQVSDSLQPGSHAIIADIEEGWQIPVDTKLEELDAIIFRKLRSEISEEILDREIESTSQELDELKAELEQASEDNKKAISNEISKAKDKLELASMAAQKRLNENVAEFDGKVAALEEQLEKAKDSKKAKLEKRLQKVKKEAEAKISRLEKAISISEQQSLE